MLQRFVKTFGGDPNKKEIEKTAEIAAQVNALEAGFEKLTDEELRLKTDEFRKRIISDTVNISDEEELHKAEQAILDEILPEAFAAVREAAKRTIGQRHYDVQLIGGLVLHQGKIAEMRTGEGKTLVATLPLYLNALTGRGVHLVTVNDYLARYQARWMAQIYNFLGLSVGLLQMASSTENGKKAFVVDLEKESTREDQHQLRLVDRVEAYRADITYGTNAEFGFDYLRDNMTQRIEDRVQRGHYYAIVDEVDNVLIDEARTPLIISGPASGDIEWYGKMAVLVRQLKAEDYEVNEKDRAVSLTEVGTAHVEQLLGQPLGDPDRPEDVTPEQAHLLGFLEQALRAQHLFRRNKDYLVQGGKVIIVDEFTGRLMPGRRWSDGLHQAVEAKENVRVEPENVTYATITLQNYFRMYQKLAGMTGTALTEAEEFDKIYKLPVLPIPTNLEYQAFGADAPLAEIKDRDEEGNEYAYFIRRDDPQKSIAFWRRKDYPDVIFRTAEAKLRAIVREIVGEHVRGRPLLVGTTSVESSERLSGRLRAEPVRRLMQVLLIRHAWMEANDRVEDGRVIPELAELSQPLDQLRPEDLRTMARDLELPYNPEDPANLERLRSILRLEASDEKRLKAVLQGGVAHQVLNARKHTEESMVIAGAGTFGMVTIATNMAGRGVDIKLGGGLEEEYITNMKDFLRSKGVQNPYGMTNDLLLEAFIRDLLPGEDFNFATPDEKQASYMHARELLAEKFGQRIGQDEWQSLSNILYNNLGFGLKAVEMVVPFWKHTELEQRVRSRSGLLVIGSERHEARRIDNQLRGRSARQGDPGASRFYLSLEDDLMRIFGGEQVKSVMERFKIDEDYPLQARMVSNMIEQSQHRVEGSNFDVRKHTLEYDDVLNSQRKRIYGQRNRVFEKEDLTDDVDELLVAEVSQRVQDAVSAEDTWRLLAWLDQIQPPIQAGNEIYPSFTLKLLLDELNRSGKDLIPALRDLAARALDADLEHIRSWSLDHLDRAGESLENQVRERMDDLDTFLDALRDRDETDTRKPQQIVEELSATIRTPLRLTPEQSRLLLEDPQSLNDPLREQIRSELNAVTLNRLLRGIEFRLGEPLGLNPVELGQLDWQEAATRIEAGLDQKLAERRVRLVGEDGQIVRELEAAAERTPGDDDQTRMRMVMLMAQGARSFFDSRTHQQRRLVFTRLNYIFFAAQLLKNESSEALEERVLDHLQQLLALQLRSRQESEAARMHIPADSPQAEEAGVRLQNNVYRQVLLGAISELWVDYLTRVEALRVSVGLEAYAQRDPLVQYKSQASDMFQGLLAEIRSAVISRIFLYRPRQVASSLEESSAAADIEPVAETASGTQQVTSQEPGKKRKRHRH